jgi:chromosome segregation ATPase
MDAARSATNPATRSFSVDEAHSITVQILIEIREQLKANNEQIKATNERIDKLREELGGKIDQTNRRIDLTNKQLVSTEARLATEIGALRATIVETDTERREVRDRLDRCEHAIAELREQVAR